MQVRCAAFLSSQAVGLAARNAAPLAEALDPLGASSTSAPKHGSDLQKEVGGVQLEAA